MSLKRKSLLSNELLAPLIGLLGVIVGVMLNNMITKGQQDLHYKKQVYGQVSSMLVTMKVQFQFMGEPMVKDPKGVDDTFKAMERGVVDIDASGVDFSEIDYQQIPLLKKAIGIALLTADPLLHKKFEEMLFTLDSLENFRKYNIKQGKMYKNWHDLLKNHGFTTSYAHFGKLSSEILKLMRKEVE